MATRTPLPSYVGWASRNRSAPISFLGMSEAKKVDSVSLNGDLLFSDFTSRGGGRMGEDAGEEEEGGGIALVVSPLSLTFGRGRRRTEGDGGMKQEKDLMSAL